MNGDSHTYVLSELDAREWHPRKPARDTRGEPTLEVAVGFNSAWRLAVTPTPPRELG